MTNCKKRNRRLNNLQKPIEQIPRQDNKGGNGTEENANEAPGHDFFQQSGLRQRQTDHGHHKGNGRAQRNAFGHKDLNYGHDSGSIGIHGDSQNNGQGDGEPIAA